MSRLRQRGRPAVAATWLAPMTPAAVPDRIICTQSRLPCSAVITPPLDLVRRGSGCTPAFFSACCSDVR
ncbi:Uncharacterised protein [Bordetella pertussis]|nr:Uncharacterised protein [Bordetella pertussis]